MLDTLTTTPLFVMKLDIGYADAVHIGDPRAGGRSIFPVTGGSFAGERLRGKVVRGEDWVTWRADGAMIIDVRLTLSTDDGAAIGMTYVGIATADAATMARFRGREILGPDEVYTRTTPRFETADPRYAWLGGLITIAKGARAAEGPIYHVYAVD